ncbi:MAG: T9SS C-terminal target domain-containing protein, partial [Bacteroidetes bacterium]
LITTSWNGSERFADDEVLFTLVVRAKQPVALSEALSVSSALTPAEAYDAQGNLLDVAIDFGTSVSGPEFALYQNTPNPFGERTVIGFTLPEAAHATLTISDVTGKVLQVIDGDFHKGYNEIALSRHELPAAGVLYYRLETPTHSASRKMIVLGE